MRGSGRVITMMETVGSAFFALAPGSALCRTCARHSLTNFGGKNISIYDKQTFWC